MSAVGRVLLLGCALLAALLPAGCGSGDSTGEATIASDAPVTTTVEASKLRQLEEHPKRHHVAAGDLCQSQLGSFVGSLDGLRRRLAVGVTYDQYVAEVRGIRSTYGKIPIGELQVDCLSLVATPAEKTFNRYIEGANEWGECVSELGCGTTEIEPVLQRRWRVASHFLSEAQDGLRAIAG
ncbi:MAG TPA: hypothetical protein VFU11_09785 [Solirubrobacterales bacterium]|nr:hypothetical protein [Solirubrobacterales bacterium]